MKTNEQPKMFFEQVKAYALRKADDSEIPISVSTIYSTSGKKSLLIELI